MNEKIETIEQLSQKILELVEKHGKDNVEEAIEVTLCEVFKEKVLPPKEFFDNLEAFDKLGFSREDTDKVAVLVYLITLIDDNYRDEKFPTLEEFVKGIEYTIDFDDIYRAILTNLKIIKTLKKMYKIIYSE